MDGGKTSGGGAAVGGGDGKKEEEVAAQAEDYIYTRTFSEERLKLRSFVRSIWMSGFIYAVGPQSTARECIVLLCSAALPLMRLK